MKRSTLLLCLAALAASGCASASPSASATPEVATAAPTAEPTDAPTVVPTLAPPPSATADVPSAEATLTPTLPEPHGSMVATWWLDPAHLPVDPGATRLHGFVLERECASGRSPEGRIVRPDIDHGAEALTITFSIVPLPGAQDCPGNPPFAVVFELEDAVQGRPILDGGTVPARDATTIP